MRVSQNQTKDPQAVLDYGFDWRSTANGNLPWLEADETITASTWTVSDGPDSTLEIDSQTHDDTTTTVWLSGGTVSSKNYRVTNHITTSAGREDDRTIFIRVGPR